MPNHNKKRTQWHFTLGRPLPVAAAAVGIIVMTNRGTSLRRYNDTHYTIMFWTRVVFSVGR